MISQQTELQLSELLDAIESWRRRAQKPTTGMPLDLWAEAVRLAKQNGLGPVARVLKLNHGKLKKLVTQQIQPGKLTSVARQRQRKATPTETTFVEIPTATVSKSFGSSFSCLLEVESSGRGRLRARIDSATPFDVATILREFAG
jgi:hypothetical protein